MNNDPTELTYAKSELETALLRGLNRTLAGAPDETELLDSLCRLVVEICGYQVAWAGFIVEFDNKRIIPASMAGNESEFFSSEEACICCDDPYCGPVFETVETGAPYIINDISSMTSYSLWRDKALRFGLKSFCSLPIKTDGKVTGVLSALCNETGKFDKSEADMLIQLAEDVSENMNSISHRIHHKLPADKGRALEEKFGALFNNTSDAIFVHEMPNATQKGAIMEVNDVACGKLGYSRHEFSTMTPQDLIHSSQAFDPDTIYKIVSETGRVQLDSVLMKKSGEPLPVRVSAHSFEMGSREYIVSIVRDTSEKIRTKKQLLLLKNAIEYSTVSVVITDRDGKIEYVNPVFEKITGYSAREAIGENPRILKSDKMDEIVFKDLWNTISGGRIWKGEFCNKKKNGELYWESAIILPVRDSAGEIVNYIGIKEDITDKKHLEEQVRHAQRLNIIGEMAGNFAHDLKNIILVIGGFAARMQKKMEQDTVEQEYLSHIIKAVSKASRLTNGLLTFGRKEPNKPEILDINILIEEYVELIERILDEKIALKLQLCPGKLPVFADAVQIEQVIMNLASNAKDAMPHGGTLTISTSTKEYQQEKGICVRFEDTGEGMEEEVRTRIFDPFFTTKDPGKGTGLGLSIVYGIIRQHGGQISCYSETGKGTVFEICLPMYLH